MIRQRLPNRRASINYTFESGGLMSPDGQVAEILLSNTKPSSQSDVNARDAAVAASLPFQFGCPLETLRRALLRDPSGKAASPLGQALDLIAREDGR
jgi:hypothetical protein